MPDLPTSDLPSRPKYHIRRYRHHKSKHWVWALFLNRSASRPLAINYESPAGLCRFAHVDATHQHARNLP